MGYLLVEMSGLLIAALAIGVYVGWVIWGWRRGAAAGASDAAAEIAALRAAHAKELAAARALIAAQKGAPAAPSGADDPARRRAHAQELAAARAVKANAAKAEARAKDLGLENVRLNARIAALQGKLNQMVSAAGETPPPAWARNGGANGAPQSGVETKAPLLLEAAPAGGGDDLKKIGGVGPKIEAALKEIGVYTFAQIADWGVAEAAWIDEKFAFPGRVQREQWIEQAKSLGAGA